MNILKIIFVFCLILLSIFLMICAFIPGKWVIKDELVINKPISIVSYELSKTQPEYFMEALKVLSVGAKPKSKDASGKSISWKHADEKGIYRITRTEKDRIYFEIDFESPYKSSGKGEYTLSDMGDSCRINFSFSGSSPFMFRITNLFIDRHYRDFFTEHLISVKKQCELQQNLIEPEIRSFMGISFKGFRKTLSADSLNFFREETYTELLRFKQFTGTQINEPYSSLTFNNPIESPSPDRFYGLVSKGALKSGIPNDTSDMGITRIFIFDRYVESYLNGDHSGLWRAHRNMQEWFIINDMRFKEPVLESYIQGPHNQSDTAKWLTRIVYSF